MPIRPFAYERETYKKCPKQRPFSVVINCNVSEDMLKYQKDNKVWEEGIWRRCLWNIQNARLAKKQKNG